MTITREEINGLKSDVIKRQQYEIALIKSVLKYFNKIPDKTLLNNKPKKITIEFELWQNQ